jgi:3-oxoacyl-[acyl-carrier-protein] synthase II
MDKRRVVITGMGVVAPNGIGVDAFWDSLIHGRSGIRKITYFDTTNYPCQVAAEVSNFDPTDYTDPKTARRLARFAQFALAASKMSVIDSKIDFDSIDPYRVGVIIGTGIGGGDCIENQYTIFMEKGFKRLSPFGAVMICTHSAAGIISCELNLKGPNTTIAAGCTSGLDAIYSAYNIIRLGDADIMLAGAGEAPITPCSIALFCACGLLSRTDGQPNRTLRPYDVDGNGTVLGEGGAVLVLEELQNALRRKAKIYGEILGYASGNEAYNIFEIDPSADAAATVIKKALENAELKPEDIDYINGHGNGSPEYDMSETLAIKKVFGELAYKIPITSIKPITGQSFSVTGILQMVTCLLVINKDIIPPTINHESPHPDCDLDYVPYRFRKAEVDKALMNALGYGGGHTVMIAGKFKSNR